MEDWTGKGTEVLKTRVGRTVRTYTLYTYSTYTGEPHSEDVSVRTETGQVKSTTPTSGPRPSLRWVHGYILVRRRPVPG